MSAREPWFAAFDEAIRDLVYGVLVDYCGANDDDDNRLQFASFWDRVDDPSEYRFIGNLGFGGKFWNGRKSWHVTCYREDETPERLEAIERANRLLVHLAASRRLACSGAA